MSTKSPLVSIIIPTYNRAHLIKETLDSILAQTYQNWECIVVDDGSTDDTDAIMANFLARDSRFQYRHRPKDRLAGGNAARNYGFEVSLGEFVQWFDSDDLMMPEKLEFKLNSILESNCDFVVCEGGELIDPKQMTYIKKWKIFHTEFSLLEHLKGNLVFGTNGPLFKKKYLENIPLFDEHLIISQEWEFFSRLLISRPKFSLLNKVLYTYRNETDGKRKVITKKKFSNKMKAQSKIIGLLNNTSFADHQYDYEIRKYFFGILKFNIKRSFKNSFYSEIPVLLRSIILVLNFNFVKEGVSRVLKKPKIIFRILK